MVKNEIKTLFLLFMVTRRVERDSRVYKMNDSRNSLLITTIVIMIISGGSCISMDNRALWV